MKQQLQRLYSCSCILLFSSLLFFSFLFFTLLFFTVPASTVRQVNPISQFISGEGFIFTRKNMPMCYFDYRHAKGVDLTAGQLYNELTKRNIPVVIMQPSMGIAAG